MSQGSQLPITPPPAPPAPPPPPSLASFGTNNNLSPETKAEVERLKIIADGLLAKIQAGSIEAEHEYDVLRKKYSDDLSSFTRDKVNPIDAKVKSIEEELKTQADILAQEIKTAELRLKEISRQTSTLNKQKERFAQINKKEATVQIGKIEALLQQLRIEHESLNQFLSQGLNNTQAKKDKITAQLTIAKTEQSKLRKDRDRLSALARAFPPRVKEKKEETKQLEVDFKAWIESGLLDGIYLENLRKFIEIKIDDKTSSERISDNETIVRYTDLVNPTTRQAKGLPCLSIEQILAIAAGTIVRAKGKSYRDANPLKDSDSDPSNQWILKMLLEDFYQANPEFKPGAKDALITPAKPITAAPAPNTAMPASSASSTTLEPKAPESQKPTASPIVSNRPATQKPIIPKASEQNSVQPQPGTSKAPSANHHQQNQLSDVILTDMKLARHELVESLRIIQQLENDTAEVDVALADDVLLRQALEKLKLLKGTVEQERTRLKQEFDKLQAAFENQSATMTMMEQKLIEAQKQLVKAQALSPVQILQQEGFGGFGHAVFVYQAEHGGAIPAAAVLNQWGDAAGLRKNPAWKTTIQQAAQLAKIYEASPKAKT